MVFLLVVKCLYFIYFCVEGAGDAYTCVCHVEVRGQSRFSPILFVQQVHMPTEPVHLWTLFDFDILHVCESLTLELRN